ncbi:MAG: DNA alkylation repair protein, partial [Acidobacteriota bacterium]|nr:DNA alkylation repair protein [Acidobacteriota bacterium]
MKFQDNAPAGAPKLTAAAVKREVSALRDPKRALFLQRFFRTGPGEYAEGDRMLGLAVPTQRRIARAYLNLSLGELEKLLQSPFHEHRLIALLILVDQHKRGGVERRAELH